MQRGPLHLAFILSRPYDLPIARRCRDSLKAHGWDANIMLDAKEWNGRLPPDCLPARYWTGGKGMFGNWCACAIIRSISDYVQDESAIVLKTDCDVRLSANSSEWLAGASGVARAMELAGTRWGGVWAAPASALGEAYEHIYNATRCACPESALTLKAFSATCGLAVSGNVEKYAAGMDVPTADAWTLPMIPGSKTRLENGMALFDF